jgi:hypothetical protein
VLAVLTAVDYAVYRSWVASLRRDDLPPWPPPGSERVPLDVWKRVGFIANEKASSFLRRPVAKPAGAVRVCAFGDSFTHGDEVEREYDYPSLLGALLAEDPSHHVEVLNFGASWFGFHQTFLLWEGYGRRYGCDYLLLGPATFFVERDTSFQHAGLGDPYYLHARFVLDGAGGVRLVDVAGDTLEERFAEYFAFLPRLAYLRYDTAPPAFIRALLPAGRTLDNPFYYRDHSRLREEAERTYAILLERMAARGNRILIATASASPGLLSGVRSPPLPRVLVPQASGFPYRAPRNHFGPLGNHLVASHFRRALTGRAALPELRAAAPPPQAHPSDPGPPLSAYDAVWIELAGAPIAYFATGATTTSRKGSPVLLRESAVASLLQIGRPRSSEESADAWSLEGCWAALDRPLAPGEEVSLRIGEDERTIGRVALLADGVAAGRVVAPVGDPRIVDQGSFLEPHALVVVNAGPAPSDEGAAAAVRVGPTRIASGRVSGSSVLLDLDRGACWRPRADEAGFVDVRSLPDSGEFAMVLQRGVAVRRVAVASWKKDRRRASPGPAVLCGSLALASAN